MTYEDAIECDSITLPEAFAELKRHGIYADHDGDELFDCATGETIAQGKDGLFNGGEILAWLGY